MAANQHLVLELCKSGEFKQRLIFLLAALFVFRIGAHIPVPGVDAAALNDFYQNSTNGILNMLNMFSGGSLERFSIFAIGIMPYISASIVVQLASEIIPTLKALKKEGEAGRKIITKYTRLCTVFLATLQGVAAAAFVYQQNVVVIGQIEFYFSTIICLVTGTMFLMWLGEQITERGIGNGISLIIMAGIASGIPFGVSQFLNVATNNLALALIVVISVLFLVYIVVYFESAQRKIPVHYARNSNSQGFLGKSNHLPFKLNMAGVIPPIFASSIILFPVTIIGWFGGSNNVGWMQKLLLWLQHGNSVYISFFAVSIIFFCYFYTALVFSPKEMAENLKKSGAFVPGVRPGIQTSLYLENVVMRITLWGAVYITVICLIPELFSSVLGAGLSLGGTSLLILVVVAMDFSTQVSSYRVSQQYEQLMKKYNRDIVS